MSLVLHMRVHTLTLVHSPHRHSVCGSLQQAGDQIRETLPIVKKVKVRYTALIRPRIGRPSSSLFVLYVVVDLRTFEDQLV